MRLGSVSASGKCDLFMLGAAAGGRYLPELQQQLPVLSSSCSLSGWAFGPPAVPNLESRRPAAVQSTGFGSGAALPVTAYQQRPPSPHTPCLRPQNTGSVHWYARNFIIITIIELICYRFIFKSF